MLERKDSATEINEALFSSVKNTSPFGAGCRQRHRQPPTDKPQLPRCNVLLSKRRE